MATVAELLVRIGGDSSGLRREINASQRQLKRAFGPEALQLSEGATGLLASLAAAMGAVGIASVKMSSDFNVSKTAFTQLLGSADKATNMMNDLATFAADTPFELPGLLKASKQLLAFQFDAQDIIPIMAAVGDSIALLGGGQEAIDSVVRALGQIQAKGKLSAEEMNQLSERGINGWKYIADAMGMSTAQVMKLSEQGAISSTAAINAVVTGMQKDFKGGMDNLSKEIPGLLSTVEDNTFAVMRKVGDSITDTFDIKNKLQGAVDYLGNFASAVQSVGIRDAILGLVPPEATAAVFAFGGALVAVAIPALYSFATAMWLAMAPMIPYIAVGTAIGLLAYEIWKNWDPLSDLFGGLWDLISNRTSQFLNRMQTDFYSAVQYVMGALSPLANLFGGSFKTTIDSWSSNAVNKLQALGNESDDLKTKIQSNLGVMSNASKNFNVGLKSLDISSLLPGAANKPNTIFTGLHGNAGTDNGVAGKTKEDHEARQVIKEEADYEIAIEKNKAKLLLDLIKSEEDDMDRQRKNGLSGIRGYWASREKEDSEGLATIKAYWDKRTDLDTQGINAELDALNAEKTALETQIAATSDPSDSIKLKKQMLDLTTSIVLKERELGEVVKKNAALSTNESVAFIEKYASLLDSTKQSMKDINTSNTTNGLFGSAKDLAGIANDRDAKMKSVDDVVKAWEKGAADIKDSYGVSIKDTAELDKWYAQQYSMIRQQSIDQANRYYSTGKALQADLDEAYNTGNLAAYKQLLNSKLALQQQDLKGQQAMADLYKTVWSDAHMSMAGVMANIGSSAYDGLKSGIADVLNGTKSISEAWNSLGSTIGSVIANMADQWIAAQIAMAIFGKSNQTKTGASAAAGGAAVATAWAPAAAMVSLATFGANAGPAMTGIALTTGLSETLAAIGGKATGGQITGPGTGTSDSILSWLSNGEYVIKASAARMLGIDALNTLNTGKMPAFATGGLVTGRSLSSVSNGYSKANAAVNNKTNANNSVAMQQPTQENHVHLHSLDGKSTERWLLNGGGKMISKYFNNQANSFALGGRT